MADMNEALRENLKAKKSGAIRAAKLNRIFAKPGQVVKQGDDIVINPPGEDALARAAREAKEARKLADEAKARAAS